MKLKTKKDVLNLIKTKTWQTLTKEEKTKIFLIGLKLPTSVDVKLKTN